MFKLFQGEDYDQKQYHKYSKHHHNNNNNHQISDTVVDENESAKHHQQQQQQQQTVSDKTTENVIVKVGQQATLPCFVSNLGSSKVS